MKRLLVALGILLITGLCFGEQPKLADELRGRQDKSMIDVIVQFKPSTTGARVSPLIHGNKVTSRGGTVKRELGLINALHVSMPASRIAELAGDEHVAYISPDRPVKTSLNNAAAAINANYAWSANLDGTGVGVAVIDSGIHVVQDLRQANGTGASRVVAAFDLVGTGTDDLYGHGTHVAGIVAGNAHASLCNNCDVPVRGIASNASIINFRVLDENGQGTDSAVISAINQAIQLKSKYNIRVINLSLGRGIFESYTLDPLCQAVEAAWNAGIVVVVAAGNDGRDNSVGNNVYGTVNAPGNDPFVITVGAMNTMGTPGRGDDVMTTYSSKGPTAGDQIVKPDLVAPGNLIVSLQAAPPSTLISTYPTNKPPVGYYKAGNAS